LKILDQKIISEIIGSEIISLGNILEQKYFISEIIRSEIISLGNILEQKYFISEIIYLRNNLSCE